MVEFLVCESDEPGGNVSLVVGQFVQTAAVVSAAAAGASDAAGAARETTTTVAVSRLDHCVRTHARSDIA